MYARPHSRFHWQPYLVVAILLAVAVLTVGQLAGRADARPLPAFHVPAITLTEGVCDDSQPMWHTTLSVTANVPGGTAHIDDPGSPWTHPVPFSHVYNLSPSYATWTVKVYVTWPDGFTSGTTTLTAHRPPSGCQPPTTVPPTTTPPLSEAPPIPPPAQPTTPVGPTPVPTPPVSTPDTTSPPPSSSSTGAAGHPTTVAHNLPVTGSDWVGVVGFAVGFILAGGFFLIITRRRAS